MYTVNIIVEEQRVKDKTKVSAVIEGEDRKEILEKTAETIVELVKENNLKKPTAEYVLTKDGTYIDGEVDLRVKVNKMGVSVKMGELIL